MSMGVEGLAHVAGGGPGGSRVSVTLRNVLGMRVQLGWGLLAPGHSHDEELCPPPSLSLCLAPWGREEGGNTGRVQRCVLSQGLKWDRWKTPTRGGGGGAGGVLTESLGLLILINGRTDIFRTRPATLPRQRLILIFNHRDTIYGGAFRVCVGWGGG